MLAGLLAENFPLKKILMQIPSRSAGRRQRIWNLVAQGLSFLAGLSIAVCYSLVFGIPLDRLNMWQAGGLGFLCVSAMALVYVCVSRCAAHLPRRRRGNS